MKISPQTQEKLLYNEVITYVSATTIKFSEELLHLIKTQCNSYADIRNLLSYYNIPKEVITKSRIKRLHYLYVSKTTYRKGIKLPTIRFTSKQVHELEKLEVVVKVSTSTITFTPEFRREVANAKSLPDARMIFSKYDIPLDVLGEKRVENSYYRFRNQYKQRGEGAFTTETRGRKITTQSESYKNLPAEEQVKILEKQLKDAQEDVEFLKKYTASSQEQNVTPKVIYSEIYKDICDGANLNLRRLFKNLKINESGYYRHVKRQNTNKSRIDRLITKEIKRYMTKHNNNKGYRQIKMHLDEVHERLSWVGFPLVNHKRIRRLMKENNIRCKIRVANPYKGMWKATVEDKVSPNILNREFKTGEPFQKLLTDITYLKYCTHKAYLSVVKDSITGEIISYEVRDDLGMSLSLNVLEKLKTIELHPEVLLHSDQGVHYTAKSYREKVKDMNITQSMSRRGNCIDNACMETFFGHLKDEVDLGTIKDFAQLKHQIDEYMIYYNHQRKQWNKKKMTPVQYRDHLLTINTA